PQLYKQILMIAGMDRYFQMAKCLRDEDLRVDRQPEFTQIDLEMSFCTPEDIYTIVEGIMTAIWNEAGQNIITPFPRISYKDSMNTYGTDKPDLRVELPITDVTEITKNSAFSVFTNAIENKGVVKCLRVPGGASLTRTDLEQFIELAKTHHAHGMAWAKVTGVSNAILESSITKYLAPEIQSALIKATNAVTGDILMFVAESWKIACTVLGQVRLAVAEKQKLLLQGSWKFAWITDFPLFAWNEEAQTWDAEHHPFCMPREQDIQYLETDPAKVYATTYDLALNGTELLSGSVRITSPELQNKIFKLLGLSEQETRTKFGFLLDAYKYGGPTHAGVGIGFDRIVALLCGLTDIREVIAFPKNKKAQCPMDGSPSAPTEQQLKELHIKRDLANDNKTNHQF
ncbi:MAG: aspartate--tRNA ligase, partial [Candidatus Woesearchaeota archaeon]|nr:aspartate--tRNA ligase [Candidatus Woesearchaeota archaeon]